MPRYVYDLSEGFAEMRALLSGKDASLAEVCENATEPAGQPYGEALTQEEVMDGAGREREPVERRH